MNDTGQPSLVWKVTVIGATGGGPAEEIYVDAGTGVVALRVPLAHTARYRKVYDANNDWWEFWGDLVREEGDPACGLVDADGLYNRLGEV